MQSAFPVIGYRVFLCFGGRKKWTLCHLKSPFAPDGWPEAPFPEPWTFTHRALSGTSTSACASLRAQASRAGELARLRAPTVVTGVTGPSILGSTKKIPEIDYFYHYLSLPKFITYFFIVILRILVDFNHPTPISVIDFFTPGASIFFHTDSRPILVAALQSPPLPPTPGRCRPSPSARGPAGGAQRRRRRPSRVRARPIVLFQVPRGLFGPPAAGAKGKIGPCALAWASGVSLNKGGGIPMTKIGIKIYYFEVLRISSRFQRIFR